jgi:hypothetical protein
MIKSKGHTIKTEKLTGPNKVLLVLGQRTSAHHEDYGPWFRLSMNDLDWVIGDYFHFEKCLGRKAQRVTIN